MADKMNMEILRYRPEQDEKPWVQKFEVPFTHETSLLEALCYIKDNLDGSLSFRWSCRMAICGSCGMMVNGTPRLACKTFLRDYAGETMRIEPLANFPIERDLVVDLSDFIEKLQRIKPYIIPKEEKKDDEEYMQTPTQLEKYHQFSGCINCGLCYAACPQYKLNKGIPLQPRQPRCRHEAAPRAPQPGERSMELHLRRLLLTGLPEGRRSCVSHPAEQDPQHD